MDATEGNEFSKNGTFNNNQYDLAEDGKCGEFSILFIILYLCRNIKNGDKVIDEFITEEVL